MSIIQQFSPSIKKKKKKKKKNFVGGKTEHYVLVL